MRHTLIALVAILVAAPAFAQNPFPDVTIGGGLEFNQASRPQSQGLAFLAKAVDKTKGIYSYTLYRITSVKIDPKAKTINVQKQAETGVAAYVKSFNLGPAIGSWDCFTAVTAGAAVADGEVGKSASGKLFCTRPVGRGIYLGVEAGPSYSSLASGGGSAGVSYPVGMTLAWGGHL